MYVVTEVLILLLAPNAEPQRLGQARQTLKGAKWTIVSGFSALQSHRADDLAGAASCTSSPGDAD